ncbi:MULTISPECIES: efflux RND transporter periplasmic adaptor subunit [Rhizobium]|uniref:RND family efflux transporter MFP subunit n=1 Tax=Rhizobium binae TaxID=1138190 RepID=A0ABV2MSZ6_9HYPH|nr:MULTISPECIES: efflux RND transporter periplasmic adaptor subunit [Rhizobium]NKL52695.1 efflux RND transporter periplasmic adaptor subunit [Rhizobium leguminosarum bv. viciae]MBX4911922.1 efflux RND transporter periplasmic adaptor subunit [Rhizobium bangladeshense]MBX4938006.1 efflux RND transporter periplasmic adaptor subunit [Rhizobium binae]MBX4944370.1 efflux RND transporter periplasmic adaptor subunit [Rhizobium binae]MBX4980468.1 efflux RND transporter periplasmic adaptor subunit [Rhiz
MTIIIRWNHKRFAAAIAIAISSLAPAGTAVGQDKQSTQIELAQADVSKAVRQDVANEVRIAGSLTPIRRSTLTSRVSSTIIELPVQIGNVVTKGDLLVRFDTEGLESAVTAKRAEIDALNAQIELAEVVLERNITLGERGAASEATRLEARANLLKLQAQLRAKQAEVADAERSLAYGELRAEFNGMVAARPVEQGQTVALNTDLMTIVDLSQMEVDAGVPTSRIPLVRLKQPVDLAVEGFPGRTFTGQVVRISPTAVAGSRAVRVFIAIDNVQGLLRGGMFTTGVLKIDDQKDVIALPTASIRHDTGGSFVLKVEDGVLRRQSVELGTSWTDRDLVEVSGIKEGDVVVTAPLRDLVAGTPVAVEGS